MNRNRAVIFAVAAIAFAAVIGFFAYNAGIQQGIVQSGKVVAPPGLAPYPYPYYGWHPWGFGFVFFPLFALFVFIVLMRAALRRGHSRWHHHGCGYREPEGAPQQQ